MPECDLLLRGVAAACEDVGDALLRDRRLRHDGDQLPNHRLVLIDDCHGSQRRKEDGAQATETTLGEGDVGVG